MTFPSQKINSIISIFLKKKNQFHIKKILQKIMIILLFLLKPKNKFNEIYKTLKIFSKNSENLNILTLPIKIILNILKILLINLNLFQKIISIKLILIVKLNLNNHLIITFKKEMEK
jgi:hypothetical protein